MTAKRLVGVVILIVGLILLGFGINATHSVVEKGMENVVGRYSENTMWYILGGSALVVVGGLLTLFGRGQKR